MSYFSPFPTVTTNSRIITDVTQRIDFLKSIKDNISLFQHIQIKDGDTPESVAAMYYDDPQLFWIILYLNNIIDPYNDWLMTDDQLMIFVESKYGMENVYDIHHYVTTDGSDKGAGIWCNLGEPFSEPVTNFDYENALNEEKRKIKVMNPAYLQQIIKEYSRVLSQQNND